MYTYIVRRTQIYLTDEEARALNREEARTGRSMSDLIREAIDDRYVTKSSLSKEQKLRALARSFGSWKGRTETGEEYVERLRSGRLARLHGWTKAK